MPKIFEGRIKVLSTTISFEERDCRCWLFDEHYLKDIELTELFFRIDVEEELHRIEQRVEEISKNRSNRTRECRWLLSIAS
jgi:hypothetical protein